MVKQISLLIEAGVILFAAMMLTSCASTQYAKINAYGVHAITPYGIISMGVLNYERAAKPDEKPKDE